MSVLHEFRPPGGPSLRGEHPRPGTGVPGYDLAHYHVIRTGTAQKKLEAIDALLADGVLDGPPRVELQNRIAGMLAEAAAVYDDIRVPETTRLELKRRIPGEYLMGLPQALAEQGWSPENVQMVLYAYTALGSPEDRYGHEAAREISRGILYDAIEYREYDTVMTREAQQLSGRMFPVSTEQGTEQHPRGFIINLSSLGHVETGVTIRRALNMAAADEGFLPRTAAYYRMGPLFTRGDQSSDTGGAALHYRDFAAQLFRVAGAQRPAELPLMMHITAENEVVLAPITPQVGGEFVLAAGMARRSRIEAVEKAQREGRVHIPHGARSDVLRNTPVPVDSVVLAVGGDGSAPQLLETMPPAAAERLPLIYVTSDNGEQIGGTRTEFWAAPLHRMGEGLGVPGVHIPRGQVQRLFMAVDFAARYARNGGGPVMINSEDVRLERHSSAHGNPMAARLAVRFLDRMRRIDGVPDTIRESVGEAVMRAGKSATILQMTEQMRALYEAGQFPQSLTSVFVDYFAVTADPLEMLTEDLLERFQVTAEEVDQWHRRSREAAQRDIAEVAARPPVDPERAIAPVFIPDLNRRSEAIPEQELSLRRVDALRLALSHSLRDPGVNAFVRGTDAVKGDRIRDEQGELSVEGEGGYWGQSNGLHEQAGMTRVMNTFINEMVASGMALGEAMAVVQDLHQHPELWPVVFWDGQYADYTMHNFPVLRTHGGVVMTTAGELTYRTVMFGSNGATPGGGTGHADAATDFALATPEGVQIYQVSRAQRMYDAVRHLGLNITNPTLFLWDRGGLEQRFPVRVGGHREFIPVEQLTTGDRLTLVTSGPMTRKMEKYLADRQLADHVAHIDLMRIRPLPIPELAALLSRTSGPVHIFGEEFEGRGWGPYLAHFLRQHPDLEPHMQQRRLRVTGSAPALSHMPCGGDAQHLVIPNIEREMQQYHDLLR